MYYKVGVITEYEPIIDENNEITGYTDNVEAYKPNIPNGIDYVGVKNGDYFYIKTIKPLVEYIEKFETEPAILSGSNVKGGM